MHLLVINNQLITQNTRFNHKDKLFFFLNFKFLTLYNYYTHYNSDKHTRLIMPIFYIIFTDCTLKFCIIYISILAE